MSERTPETETKERPAEISPPVEVLPPTRAEVLFGVESPGAITPGLRHITPAQVRKEEAEEWEGAVASALIRGPLTKRLKAAALTMTGILDWVSMKAQGGGEIPYLQESGAAKIIHAFNVEFQIKPAYRVDYPPDKSHPDGSYEFVYEGLVRARSFGFDWLFIVGSRWSGDGFFTRAGTVVPDPGDVRKAALSNFYQNAITKVCGLENVSWDELALSGIDPAKVRSVEFKLKPTATGRSGDRPPVASAPPDARDPGYVPPEVPPAGVVTGAVAGAEAGESAAEEKGFTDPEVFMAGDVLAVKLDFHDLSLRSKIKQLGGKWDNTEKAWAFENLGTTRTALKALGLNVPEPEGGGE